MRKQIKKYGDAFIIRFSKEEREVYDIEEGKVFDIELSEVKDGGTNTIKK